MDTLEKIDNQMQNAFEEERKKLPQYQKELVSLHFLAPTYPNKTFTQRILFLEERIDDLLYSVTLGGSDADVGNKIALDSSGNAYVLGHTLSSDFPVTAGAFQTHFEDGTFAGQPAGDCFSQLRGRQARRVLVLLHALLPCAAFGDAHAYDR